MHGTNEIFLSFYFQLLRSIIRERNKCVNYFIFIHSILKMFIVVEGEKFHPTTKQQQQHTQIEFKSYSFLFLLENMYLL